MGIRIRHYVAKRLGLPHERPSHIIENLSTLKKIRDSTKVITISEYTMKKQLHEYPIGQPITFADPPRLGQTYWIWMDFPRHMVVVPQVYGYSPSTDRDNIINYRAFRTKEDVLYACRRGYLQEIPE